MGQRDQAAAGPAVGARGRARPGASGSRCGTKPARHDFSRRAATPDFCGAAVTAAASRAPCATRAMSRHVSVTAASAIRPAGFPSGTSAKPSQLASPVRADSRLPSVAITVTSVLRPPPVRMVAGTTGVTGLLLRALPFATLAIAAVVPLAAGLYLATTTA